MGVCYHNGCPTAERSWDRMESQYPDVLFYKVNTIKSEDIRDKYADGSNKPIKIAPGEGKIPTNIMREENVDVKAFPRHHPSGQYGLDHKREFKLSPSQYF